MNNNVEMVDRAKELGITIYLCPVTGRPLSRASGHDDKVVCHCGHGNPALPKPAQSLEVRTHVHYVEGLEKIGGKEAL